MLAVPVDVVYVDQHVLGHFIATRRPELTARPTQHDGSRGYLELRVGDDSVLSRITESLGETKRAAEPINGDPDVRVDQDRDDWRRAISSGATSSTRVAIHHWFPAASATPPERSP